MKVQFFSWSDELSICLLFIQNHYFWWPQFVFLTAHNLRRSKWTKGCVFSKALFHQDALLSAHHCPLISVNPWCWVLFEFFVWFLADIKQPGQCWDAECQGLLRTKLVFKIIVVEMFLRYNKDIKTWKSPAWHRGDNPRRENFKF